MKPVIASIQFLRIAFHRLHSHRRIKPERFKHGGFFALAASEFFSNLRPNHRANPLQPVKSEAISTARASLRSFAFDIETLSIATQSLLFEVRLILRIASLTHSADSFAVPFRALTPIPSSIKPRSNVFLHRFLRH